MRGEGDVANLIVSAAVWRRIGVIGEDAVGVTLLRCVPDPGTAELQRFLARKDYPQRLTHASDTPLPAKKASPIQKGGLPAVIVRDGHTLYRPTLAELADELGITELPDP